MPTPIRMPDIGTVESEVTIVRWLKSIGEHVAAGEALVEVETDKGVNPIESVAEGTLLARRYEEGAKAVAGDVIAWVGKMGEPVPDSVPSATVPSGSLHAASAQEASARVVSPVGAPAVSSPAATERSAEPARIAPVIRSLAERYGVDLARVQATGPGGTITRGDILRARDAATGAPAAVGPAATARAPAAPVAEVGPAEAGPAGIGLSPRQAAVARAVSLSHREKPTFSITMQVEMTKAMALRESLARSGSAPAWDAVFVLAVGRAIASFPVFRRWMQGEKAREHAVIDVAFAVGAGEDLFAPVVREADRKDLGQAAPEVERLVARARSHALSAQDSAESCFLVSNLGMLPVESFEAIVYPTHSAALAVGAITPTPVGRADGSLRVAPMARLTLTVDHRIANGLTAASFLARVKEILEAASF